jgi:excisionase family DNA binding protein
MAERPDDLDSYGTVMSPEDVASVLQVSTPTVRTWINQGVLPGRRMAGGRRLFVLKEDLRRFLESQPFLADEAVEQRSNAHD